MREEDHYIVITTKEKEECKQVGINFDDYVRQKIKEKRYDNHLKSIFIERDNSRKRWDDLEKKSAEYIILSEDEQRLANAMGIGEIEWKNLLFTELETNYGKKE